MSRTKDVFWDSTYYFSGLVLAAIVAYLTKLLLVRTLTVEEYGLFFAVFTFVIFFATFRGLGISSGLVRYLAEYNTKKKYGAIKSLILGSTLLQLIVSLLVVVVMWALAPWLAETYFGHEEAVWLLRLLSFYLPLSIAFTNIKAILNGLKLNKWLASAELIKNTLVLAIIAISLYLGARLYAPAYGYLLALVVFFFIFLLVILKNHSFWKHKITGFYAENKKLVLFSLPLIFTSVGSLFITYFDTLILTGFDTLTAVGVYNIVYPSALMLGMIGVALGTILLPIMTELWSENKKNEIIKAFRVIYKYLLVVCMPVLLVLMILARPAIRILFGEDYILGVVAFNILLVAAFFKVVMTVNYRTLIGLDESKNIMSIYAVGAISNVLLNLVLIPLYSINGAAIATTTSFFLMLVMSFIYLRKKVLVQIPYAQSIVIILSSLAIPALAYITPTLIPQINIYISTIAGIIFGGIAYLSILYAIKFISVQEIKELLT